MTRTTFAPAEPIWCAGCGHFAVQEALVRVLASSGRPPHEVIVLAGIGCSGTVQNTIGTYGFHALHGRVLPTATGVALANPALTVVAISGDGDGYAIGAGHLVHAFRRNSPILYVVMNNGTYGLTKGQPSPTTGQFAAGHADAPVDGVRLGLSIPGSTFIARGFARRWDQMEQLLGAALAHAHERRGFAFVEVVSPCVTYRDGYAALEGQVHDVDAESGYVSHDRAAAFRRAVELEAEGKLPVGLVFRDADAVSQPSPAQSPALVDVDPGRHRTEYTRLMAGFSM